MKLIVGLGNPGRQYSMSRHNIGFRCLSRFARDYRIRLNQRMARAMVGRGEVAGVPIVLAKPQTFMNYSGDSVGPLLIQLRLSHQDLIVVYDDLDLPLGHIRIRPSGGAGGHRGMKSIIQRIGSQDFPRIRVGIGRPGCSPESASPLETVKFVLGRFSADEERVVQQAMTLVSRALHSILTDGLDKTMSRFNSRAISAGQL